MSKMPEAFPVELKSGHPPVEIKQVEPLTVGAVKGPVVLPAGAATEDTLKGILTDKTFSAALARVLRGFGAIEAAERIAAIIGTERGPLATGLGISSTQTLRVAVAQDCRQELSTKYEQAETPISVRLSTGKEWTPTGPGGANEATPRVVLATPDQPFPVEVAKDRTGLSPVAAGGISLKAAPLDQEPRAIVASTQRPIKRAVIQWTGEGMVLLAYVRQGVLQHVAAGVGLIDVAVEIPAGVNLVVKAIEGSVDGSLTYTFLG